MLLIAPIRNEWSPTSLGSSPAFAASRRSAARASGHLHTLTSLPHRYDDKGVLSGNVGYTGSNSTMRATAPPPAPTPERVPVLRVISSYEEKVKAAVACFIISRCAHVVQLLLLPLYSQMPCPPSTAAEADDAGIATSFRYFFLPLKVPIMTKWDNNSRSMYRTYFVQALGRKRTVSTGCFFAVTLHC